MSEFDPLLTVASGRYGTGRFSQNTHPCQETIKGLYLVLPLIAGSQGAIFNANQAN
jgi:hypothetical protein